MKNPPVLAKHIHNSHSKLISVFVCLSEQTDIKPTLELLRCKGKLNIIGKRCQYSYQVFRVFLTLKNLPYSSLYAFQLLGDKDLSEKLLIIPFKGMIGPNTYKYHCIYFNWL